MPTARLSIPLLAVLLGAAAASADSVEITYGIQPGSTIGGSTVPGLSGTYKIRVTALSSSQLIAGPSTLVSLAPTQGGSPFFFATYGLVGLPGSFPLTRLTLTAGGGVITAFSVGTAITGNAQQLGTLTIPFPPFVVPTGTGRDDFAVWRTTGRLDFTFAGYSGMLPNYGERASFVGQEVSRTFMPEAAGEWVLPAGAIIVGALGWRRRHRA